MYAISTEREFNASTLILGRSRPDIADMTDPSRWQWASGWVPSAPERLPAWSSSISAQQPILSWPGHITYPRMSFDPGLRRYLLTFTYSYAPTPPAIWQSGSELVMLEAPHPWGPAPASPQASAVAGGWIEGPDRLPGALDSLCRA